MKFLKYRLKNLFYFFERCKGLDLSSNFFFYFAGFFAELIRLDTQSLRWLQFGAPTLPLHSWKALLDRCHRFFWICWNSTGFRSILAWFPGNFSWLFFCAFWRSFLEHLEIQQLPKVQLYPGVQLYQGPQLEPELFRLQLQIFFSRMPHTVLAAVFTTLVPSHHHSHQQLAAGAEHRARKPSFCSSAAKSSGRKVWICRTFLCHLFSQSLFHSVAAAAVCRHCVKQPAQMGMQWLRLTPQ